MIICQTLTGDKFVHFMVPNATFNNISAISGRSALLVAETGGLGVNHRSVVIGTDCIGSCKSNYQTITATTKWGRFSLVTIHFSNNKIDNYQQINTFYNIRAKVSDDCSCAHINI